MGGLNWLLLDVGMTILKISYFCSLESSELSTEQKMIYTSMVLAALLTIGSLAWYIKHVLVTKETIIKVKVCEQLFLQLNTKLDIFILN